MRPLRWHGRRIGVALIRSVTLASITVLVIHAFVAALGLYNIDWVDTSWSFDRARILSHLQQEEGLHLVVVRYEPDHVVLNEWVYNESDIDRAKVVWAREMDDAQNRELLKYFEGRHVWLLEADGRPIEVVPYPLPDS